MEWVGDKVMGSGEGWANWRIYGCYMKKAGTQLQKLVSCGNAGTALPDVLGFFCEISRLFSIGPEQTVSPSESSHGPGPLVCKA